MNKPYTHTKEKQTTHGEKRHEHNKTHIKTTIYTNKRKRRQRTERNARTTHIRTLRTPYTTIIETQTTNKEKRTTTQKQLEQAIYTTQELHRHKNGKKRPNTIRRTI